MVSVPVHKLSNPFPGLRPFEKEESDLFFGRETQTDELLRRLRRSRFLAVVGTSGSGKSSLVRAGLLPALHGGFMVQAGSHWRVAIMRPGADPMGSLACELDRPEVLGREADDPEFSCAMMEATLRRGSLGLCDAYRLAWLPSRDNLLVVVDQFEELFRFKQGASLKNRLVEEDAAAFVKLLLDASLQRKLPIYILLTMRSDYLGDCAQFRGLPEAINDGQYLIPRLTREQLRSAIEQPITITLGKREMITSRLTNRLLNEMGDTPDRLPILQHAMMRTWQHWDERGVSNSSIDIEDYEAIGGMGKALSRHADHIYKSLPTDRVRKVAERLFRCITEKDANGRGIRRPITFGQICQAIDATEAEVQQTIDAFRGAGKSFLMPPPPEELTPATIIDISHESFMRVWRRLKGWLLQEAASAQIYVRLADTALLEAAGKAELYRGRDLDSALEWQKANKPKTAWAQRYEPHFETAMKFLERSKAARKRVEEEKEAAQKRVEEEKEAAQKKEIQRRNKIIARLIILIFVIVAILFYSLWQRKIASKQKNIAFARQLTNEAYRLTTSRRNSNERDTGALLAVWAYDKFNKTQGLSADLDLALRQSLAGLPTLLSHNEDVLAASFSPDGKIIATASADNTAKLWNAETGEELFPDKPLKHDANVLAVSFSPNDDGKTIIATASADNTARLWDVETGEELHSLKHDATVLAVSFSPDDEIIATASVDGTAKLWDVETGEELHSLKHQAEAVLAVSFSHDGKTIATASADNTAKLWNVETGEEMHSLKHDRWVQAVSFSRDDEIIATASVDGTAKLWNAETGKELVPLHHNAPVLAVSFSPDDKTIATASRDHTARLWNVETGEELVSLNHTADVLAVSFSPDGKIIATTSADHTARLWNPDNGTEWAFLNHTADVLAVSFRPAPYGPKSNPNYQGLPIFVTASADHTAKLWNANSRDELFSLKHKDKDGKEYAVLGVSFSPNGKIIATASADYTARLWDAATGEELVSLDHTDDVLAVSFSPDGKTIATASADYTARLWDAATGEELVSLDHTDDVLAVSFSPDGKTIATTSADHTARLWNAEKTGDELPPNPLSRYEDVLAVSFSPDGKTIAIASVDNTARLWDVETDKEVFSLKHDANVLAVSFSPDGKIIATASADNTARLWNVETSDELRSLKHDATVQAVSFSPDGKIIATASDDHTARLWDADTGEELAHLKHNRPVQAVSFNPDGKTIATASIDRTAKLWHVELAALRKKVCKNLSRNLRASDWKDRTGKPLTNYERTCINLDVHPSVMEEAIRKAENGKNDSAIAIFKRVQDINGPDFDLDPRTHEMETNIEEIARKYSEVHLVRKAKELARECNLDEATAMYKDARKRNPEINLRNPAEILDSEKAAEQDPIEIAEEVCKEKNES